MADRVQFSFSDNRIFEVHTVPLGADANEYAKTMLPKLRPRNGAPLSYSILPMSQPEGTKHVPEATPALGISRQLQHATIRLECMKPSGAVSSGTGFHFRLQLKGDTWVPAIITNKHVVAGASECAIHLSLADATGAALGLHERYIVKPFQWLDHPDPTVDLALIPIQPLLAQLSQVGKRPFYIDLVESLIPEASVLEGLSPLEEILLVGYPNGIWDTENNFPIFRRGITATPCNKKYLGRTEFLVDAAVFPGSSGSPVFIYNEGTYLNGNSVIFGGRLLLIGVLYAVHLHTAQGEIRTVTVPTDTKSMSFSAIPNNLGICLHAARILEFRELLQRVVDSQG
ncbi:trypsin-like peptidase domain-containing protein [Bradyrhizobium sp. 138]|uniref:S1 family peptidase n=1 Tax=Bradyrhizobium sp. 138 TaxID=2782615 RepID=UPI001FF98E96|nr:serine protease [Bradyrhizobium sp. 138]MCK1734844.1 trypsin-like peptidase domain-containing protein [Bradyrhizobium sp. 138]